MRVLLLALMLALLMACSLAIEGRVGEPVHESPCPQAQ